MSGWLNRLWGWRTFNDRLALLLVVLIPAMWIADGLNALGLDLSEAVSGALIVTWTLVTQFYFRKAPEPPVGGPL